MENSSKLDSVQGSDQVIEVAADTTAVCYRGTGNALGHARRGRELLQSRSLATFQSVQLSDHGLARTNVPQHATRHG